SWPCSGRAGYTNTGRTAPAMAETSELIDFRRAFVWLLCGMLLPSVALVAFGVVAVANERAAVERRLSEEYDARLNTLALDVMGRLDKAADAVSAGLAVPARPRRLPADSAARAGRGARRHPPVRGGGRPERHHRGAARPRPSAGRLRPRRRASRRRSGCGARLPQPHALYRAAGAALRRHRRRLRAHAARDEARLQ